MSKQYKMLIGGELVTAKTTFSVVNPATEEVIAEVPDAEPAHIEDCLKSADKAFASWSKTSLAEREKIILDYANLLEKNKDEIIDILISETGKPIENAEYDFGMLVTCLKFFIEEAKRLDTPVINDPDGRFHHYISRQPLGIVVGYLAWNFPLLNIGYKIGPSLAAGCCAIIKPSQVTPMATLRCAELAIEAGIPAGVLNVITSNNYDITNPLLTSDLTSMFTMIGSTKAGVKAMQTACTSVKHFSVELGGNAPVIVYDDADVEKAAEKIVGLKFANSGQVCVSPNRVFVHQSIYEKFLSSARKHAKQIKLGVGRQEGNIMGPMMTDKERQRVIGLIEKAIAQGANLVAGGSVPSDKQKGFYLEPTILSDVSLDMAVANDEIFGPVLPVIPYSDSDDIIELANDNQYGLSAYVFTESLKRGMQAAENIQAGSVCINEPHYSVQLPHGGLKQSGVGKDCSRYSLQEYLTLKRVSVLIKD
ncbi:aldehyde dehydrogenase family protein [Gayadomonas joobiniege]|uniref:aldehyde dehydrogenase family protein n=1 Tax=Gayadomonas joobiniege TaxID=1234606 RepID=UPI0003814537|nr:aldehyde dehydrogenase family protein [Gayadomonas joobiniege]